MNVAPDAASAEPWRELVAANEPELRPTSEPIKGAHRALRVEVVGTAHGERESVARTFWNLLGELAADVVMDGVDGPWGSAINPNKEKLAA